MNYSSKIYIVHIPVMVYTKEEKFMLLKESMVKDYLEMYLKRLR